MPPAIDNLRFGSVTAIGIFLVPLAPLVLPADFGLVASDLLFRRDDARGFQRLGMGRECFRINLTKPVGPTAVVRHDLVDHLDHALPPLRSKATGFRTSSSWIAGSSGETSR